MANINLLIVDDDKFLLGMYKKKFETSGATVDLISSPREALEKLRGGAKPDVLLLDIIMPEMDGLELLGTIRKEKLCPETKVVMLTNEGGSDKLEQAKSLGIASYIVKATSVPSEVVAEVRRVVNKDNK